MMNNILHRLLSAAVLVAACTLAQARDKVVFVPQYKPQAQFAGFYVAQAKNFYAEEGLDVEIRHIGNTANETAESMLLEGKADIGGIQLASALSERHRGSEICCVMQLMQRSGLCCVTRKPIGSMKELDGIKVSRWPKAYAEISRLVEKNEGVNIHWVPSFDPVHLYIYGAVDAVLVYSFSELIQLKQALGGVSEENIFRFSNHPGLDIPEDGLYVTQQYYSKNRDVVERFVRATKRGWDYARSHMDEALQATWPYISEYHGVTNAIKEREMLEECLRLQINPYTGKADYAHISKDAFDSLESLFAESGDEAEKVDYSEFIKQ